MKASYAYTWLLNLGYASAYNILVYLSGFTFIDLDLRRGRKGMFQLDQCFSLYSLYYYFSYPFNVS